MKKETAIDRAKQRLAPGNMTMFTSNGSIYGDQEAEALIEAALGLGIKVQISGTVERPVLEFVYPKKS